MSQVADIDRLATDAEKTERLAAADLGDDGSVEPGQVCSVVATFIEDRNGRALVRLPNGSKTSVPYGALLGREAQGHFIPAQDGSSVDVFCGRDERSTSSPDFNSAADELVRHTTSH